MRGGIEPVGPSFSRVGCQRPIWKLTSYSRERGAYRLYTTTHRCPRWVSTSPWQLRAAEWSAMGLHEERGTHRSGGTVCPTSVGNPPGSRLVHEGRMFRPTRCTRPQPLPGTALWFAAV